MKHAHGATIRAEIWLEASLVGHPFLPEADLLGQQAKVREFYLPQAENWVAELDGEPAGHDEDDEGRPLEVIRMRRAA